MDQQVTSSCDRGSYRGTDLVRAKAKGHFCFADRAGKCVPREAQLRGRRPFAKWDRFTLFYELAFKRLKSLLQLGHLKKTDPQGAKAWLQGKLLIASLIETLIAVGERFSPWGYLLPRTS